MQRIKLESEFIISLGTDWKSRVSGGWSPAMDKLFGLNYPFSFYNDNTITGDMVTTLPLDKKADELFMAKVKEFENRIEFTEYNEGPQLSQIYKIYYHHTGRSHEISYFNNNATGNCQNGVLMYFNNLLQNNSADDVREILRSIRRTNTAVTRKMAIIDVEKKYISKVQQLNPVLLNPYTSTNGSEMALGLLQFNKL